MKHNFNNFIVFSFQPKASPKPPKKTDLLFEEGEEEDLFSFDIAAKQLPSTPRQGKGLT